MVDEVMEKNVALIYRCMSLHDFSVHFPIGIFFQKKKNISFDELWWAPLSFFFWIHVEMMIVDMIPHPSHFWRLFSRPRQKFSTSETVSKKSRTSANVRMCEGPVMMNFARNL